MCTIGPRRFSRFLQAFRADNPDIEVTLHDVIEAVIPELLLSGNLDCVICARAENHDQRFQAVSLFKENMVVAFADSHRFSDFETVSWAELAQEPYLDRLHCEFRDDFLSITKTQCGDTKRARGLDTGTHSRRIGRKCVTHKFNRLEHSSASTDQ